MQSKDSLEVLVATGSRNSAAIWAQCRVQDPSVVSLVDIGDLGHRRIGIDAELVVWQPMSCQEFLGVRIKDDGSHLRVGDQRIEAR
jgi:pyrimidine operon attenuation protein/uracil phosphoribosyltransferase